MIITRSIFVSCVICTATTLVLATPEEADSIEWITRPSKDPTLSFVRSGRIAEVLVKKGDVVQAGQLLVRQDDAAEQVKLKQLKAKAEDTNRIDAAKADWDQKKLDKKKVDELFERGATMQWEVDQAKLQVTIAEIRWKIAQFDQQQAIFDHQQVEIDIERMKLSSPITGKVEKLLVQQGESVQGLEDVVQMVKIDPLWIDVPAPLTRITEQNIKVGQSADVKFAASSGEVRHGTIIHIAAVADAASGTLTVRVEVPNPDGPTSRPAGEHVRVHFTGLVETASVQKGNIKVTNISQKSENKE